MSVCTFCLGLIAFAVLSVTPAEAKNVHLGQYSRSTIDTSCARAGGASFGTDDEEEYGCKTSNANVVCTVEGDCVASVSDTAPVPGNSLSAILGIRRTGEPQRIEAMDLRVKP